MQETGRLRIFISRLEGGLCENVGRRISDKCPWKQIEFLTAKEGIAAGEKLSSGIQEEIQCSDHVLLITTWEQREEEHSWWMGFEYGYATAIGKRVMPMIADRRCLEGETRPSGFLVNRFTDRLILAEDENSVSEYYKTIMLIASKRLDDQYSVLTDGRKAQVANESEFEGHITRAIGNVIALRDEQRTYAGKVGIVTQRHHSWSYDLKFEDGNIVRGFAGEWICMD